ncbi:MAG: glycosyltransferase [Bacteroides sp.]|nr:glycosyltransferase [Bacteroides sp.]
MNFRTVISVIIPNYNYAPYLRERIDSVLNQTFQDFELILLDDASTDNSVEILNKYRDNPHITHIKINEKNTGSPFQQWLKGISLAKGTYIWIAESDDIASPRFLETTVPLLEQHPDAAICFSGSTLIDEHGNIILHDINKWSKKAMPQKYRIFNGNEYVRRNMYWRNYIANASAAIFRKSSFEQANPTICSEMRYSGDWLFWTRLALHGSVIEVYEELNFFRQHARKVTVKAANNGGGKMEDIEIIRQIELATPIKPYKRTIRHGIL